MKKLTTRERIYAAFACLALFSLAAVLGLPTGNSQFWTVLASWVQAVGSIGAIAAAIWIGQKQHDQNVALVTEERERIKEEKQAETVALRDALNAVIQPLLEDIDDAILRLEPNVGSDAPLLGEDEEVVEDLLKAASETTQTVIDMRDVFVGAPFHLVAHGQIVGSLRMMEKRCGLELNLNRSRKVRAQQTQQAAFNRANLQREPSRPFSTTALRESRDLVRSAFEIL